VVCGPAGRIAAIAGATPVALAGFFRSTGDHTHSLCLHDLMALLEATVIVALEN